MKTTVRSLTAATALLAFGGAALGNENFAGFQRLATPEAQPTAPAPAPARKTKPAKAAKVAPAPTPDPFGPVESEKLSIANIAPVLLPYFNNGPVFGLPGTVTGDIANRTQVTGDWGGARTELARRGWFVDVYTTSAYQNVTSGGMKTGDSFVQNTQASVNVDLGRAGLSNGGLFHFTLQSRYGAPPDETLAAGSAVPQYVGYVQPGPPLFKNTLASEYFLVQPLSPKVSVVLGKISDVFIPDQTLFGNSYKYYFANFNLNKNPITTAFYNPTAWAALAIATPTKWWTIGGGVLDTESKSSNLATNAFRWVNLYLTSVFTYSVAGLPGQLSPSFNWSNKPKVDLSRPLAPLVAAADEAVGTLSGGPAFVGRPESYKHASWFAIANVSQYLYVKDDPDEVAHKLKSGVPINGVGVFARGGFAPQSSNTITANASVALYGHGMIEGRAYDSFGAGFYYNRISDHIKQSVAALTLNRRIVQDETGVEAFYNFALTPAIRLIPSYQHIWNPLIADVVKGRSHADVFLARVNVAW
jgi:carbohydrate-selective porin OprB